MSLTAIIVEDEQIARETLSGYLKKYCDDVQLLDVCENIHEAKKSIEVHQPDIVFLDIEMPYGNGFDLLEKFDEIEFETVFVTAFGNYAIKALNMSAAYYLLKPIDIDELQQAVAKIKQGKKDGDTFNHTGLLAENLKNTDAKLHKLALPLIDGFEVVKLIDVIRCQANDNFTDLYLVDGRKLMICRTLKYYEQLLSQNGFFRIHKSHLINVDYVKKYIRGKGGQVVMADGAELEVAPNRKKDFLSLF